MDKIVIEFRIGYTRKYVDEQWIATGNRVKDIGYVNIDETTLTPAQRNVIFPHLSVSDVPPYNKIDQITLEQYEPNIRFGNAIKSSIARFDATPTLAEILAFLKRMEVQKAEAQTEGNRLQAEEQERQAKAKADQLAKEEAAQELKKRRVEERNAWIAEHGSVHLKKCKENRYDCTRLYYIERAELEYPGGSLDYNNTATWKERSGPSLEALEMLEMLKASYPKDTIRIVWLTSGPTNEPDEDEAYMEEGREAIVLKPAAYNAYWVVFEV